MLFSSGMKDFKTKDLSHTVITQKDFFIMNQNGSKEVKRLFRFFT